MPQRRLKGLACSVDYASSLLRSIQSSNECIPRPFRGDLSRHRKGGPSTVNTEDEVLTRYLTGELKAARCLSMNRPVCPHCQSPFTIPVGRTHGCPCPISMHRLPAPVQPSNGTPLARLRQADQLYEFVRLLSCQMSYKEAAEILQVDYSVIAN